jgi:hypothetical protein
MFRELDFSKENVVAIEINGDIRLEDYDLLIGLMDRAKKIYNNTRLFVHINNIGGIALQDMTQDLKKYFKDVEYLEKVAVVGSHPIDKIVAKIADPYVEESGGKVKYFSANRIVEAKNWILN